MASALLQRVHVSCAHCGTPIVDAATLQRRGDEVFCCNNCLAAADGATEGTLVCAHCATPIVDASTEAEVDGRIYCCLNCAEAYAGLAAKRTT